MKVTGFTIIRNAIQLDYPVVEAITSILPICDDFVVAVGKSEDDTLELIKNISSEKIKIIETEWDDSLRKDGKVLSVETNKSFQAIPHDTDWAFYIQADEVVHEKYLNTIYKAMVQWKDDKRIDALLFNYLHFYGSYNYVGKSYRWYRREMRVIRNDKSIYSYHDAQSFRKVGQKKLNVKYLDAYIYHYGWVKHPVVMQQKREKTSKFWHDDRWMEENIFQAKEFNFDQIDALNYFDGTHPKVMQERIQKRNWKFDFDLSYNRMKMKDKFKTIVQKLTGYHIGEFKNFKIIK
jgi:hypothetical protein